MQIVPQENNAHYVRTVYSYKVVNVLLHAHRVTSKTKTTKSKDVHNVTVHANNVLDQLNHHVLLVLKD